MKTNVPQKTATYNSQNIKDCERRGYRGGEGSGSFGNKMRALGLKDLLKRRKLMTLIEKTAPVKGSSY